MTLEATALRNGESKKVEKVKRLLVEQTLDHPLGMPHFYAVLYYGRAFNGQELDPFEYRKRWDINEVRKTHSFVSRLLRKYFGDELPLWWFINRHEGKEDPSEHSFTLARSWDIGEYRPMPNRVGAFHSDLYIGDISDNLLETPTAALQALMEEEDDIGCPIHCRNASGDYLKQLLLNACIRKAKWVGRHHNSLKVSAVPPEEMASPLFYGLKDLKELDDLNSIIDWDNSSFYTPN